MKLIGEVGWFDDKTEQALALCEILQLKDDALGCPEPVWALGISQQRAFAKIAYPQDLMELADQDQSCSGDPPLLLVDALVVSPTVLSSSFAPSEQLFDVL